MHTPSSAARATGVTRSTIYTAIKAGRLPAHQLHSGKYAIYPAEFAAHFHQHRRCREQRARPAPTTSASHDGILAGLLAGDYRAT